MAYSRPSIEFAASVQPGMRFKAAPDRPYMPHRDQILTLQGVAKQTRNPDDIMYTVVDERGKSHQVRGWWLRQHWRVMEN